MRTRHLASWLVGVFALTTASCAALVPPVPERPERPGEAPRDVVLEPNEGRPASLLLGVTHRDAVEGDLLILQRSAGDETLEILSVPIDAKLQPLLAAGDLVLSDEPPRSPRTYTYRVVLEKSDTTVTSEWIEVEWGDVPQRADEVVVRELDAGVVEVGWRPKGAAALFIRDVLDERSGTVRIDVPSRARGKSIVRGLSPDGVYAFRVARARADGEYVRYGTPTEEVYVTLTGTPRGGSDAEGH